MAGDPVEILLVEDTPSHAEMTIRALRKDNISNHIQVVSDGAEAIEFVGSKSCEHGGGPMLILLDLKLPKIDGIEVLRRIRENANPAIRKIPVIILTSSQEDRDVRACYDLGVHSYIVKPVDFRKLADAVRTLGFYWDTADFYRVLLSHHPN